MKCAIHPPGTNTNTNTNTCTIRDEKKKILAQRIMSKCVPYSPEQSTTRALNNSNKKKKRGREWGQQFLFTCPHVLTARRTLYNIRLECLEAIVFIRRVQPSTRTLLDKKKSIIAVRLGAESRPVTVHPSERMTWVTIMLPHRPHT